tara:strand:+ start:58855 stop:59160 length:306 start_codon:yes stop_codon:yes gene_type:complete
MNKFIIASLGMVLCSVASAALPPLGVEAQAKADETKNKAEWSKKVASYQLCLTQNKTADRYLQKNNKPKPATDLPPCQNPGAYVPQQAQVGGKDVPSQTKN